jgi:hypothetical protein
VNDVSLSSGVCVDTYAPGRSKFKIPFKNERREHDPSISSYGNLKIKVNQSKHLARNTSHTRPQPFGNQQIIISEEDPAIGAKMPTEHSLAQMSYYGLTYEQPIKQKLYENTLAADSLDMSTEAATSVLDMQFKQFHSKHSSKYFYERLQQSTSPSSNQNQQISIQSSIFNQNNH